MTKYIWCHFWDSTVLFLFYETTTSRFMHKRGVMTTIRPEDDMALVSSTMARVFVNRWLLMTGRRPSSRNPPQIHPCSTHPSVLPSFSLSLLHAILGFHHVNPIEPTTYLSDYNPSRFQLINYANLRDSCRSNLRDHPLGWNTYNYSHKFWISKFISKLFVSLRDSYVSSNSYDRHRVKKETFTKTTSKEGSIVRCT